MACYPLRTQPAAGLEHATHAARAADRNWRIHAAIRAFVNRFVRIPIFVLTL